MLVTLEGMTISDRESQPENAQSPMRSEERRVGKECTG